MHKAVEAAGKIAKAGTAVTIKSKIKMRPLKREKSGRSVTRSR